MAQDTHWVQFGPTKALYSKCVGAKQDKLAHKGSIRCAEGRQKSRKQTSRKQKKGNHLAQDTLWVQFATKKHLTPNVLAPGKISWHIRGA